MTENPVTKFACNDKIECELIKARCPAQALLCLVLVMIEFKVTGKYDVQIHNFEAKPAINCRFNTFRPFIINEYSKCMVYSNICLFWHHKWIKEALYNEIGMDKNAAWAIVEVTNAMQLAQNKQTKKLMLLFQTRLQTMQGKLAPAHTQMPGTCNRQSC